MGRSEALVLRLLMDHPMGMYGSEFVHHSRGKLNRGTVYTLLDRMVDKGLVRKVEDPASPSMNRARTRHLLTPKGRAAFRSFLDDLGLQMRPIPS